MKAWYHYSFCHWINRSVEKIQMEVAWKLPKWMVRWCVVRVFAHATTGKYSSTLATDLSLMTALKRFEDAR